MASNVEEELIEILNNPASNIQAKILGFKLLLSLSASEEGLKKLTEKEFLSFLISHINDATADKRTLSFAFQCLINISATQEGAIALLNFKKDLIFNFQTLICDEKCDYSEYVCYILSNLSTCCDIQKQEDFIRTKNIDNLIKCFTCCKKELRKKFQFLTLYFANLTSYPGMRRLLLGFESFFTCMLELINPGDTLVHRMGTALTLRNICYETDLHTTLLQRDILPVLLLPLMGNDRFEDEIMEHLPIDCQYLEESKTREPDAQVRKALVQALSLLCYTEYGWNYLKDHSVYHVCRELHLWETDPTTKEAIETLVGFLLVENYSGVDPGNNEDSLVVPSVTEIVKDIPDFILTM